MDTGIWRRRVRTAGDRTLTALAVVAAVVFVSSAVTALLDLNRPSPTMAQKLGSVVDVSEADWTRHQATLLIAVQADCTACDTSVDFYRDLLASNVAGAFHPVVVVPYSAAAGARQVKEYGLDIADVRSVRFETLGIPGTPTIMLVGPDGRLRKAWIGKLPASAEDAVFRALGIQRLARTSKVVRPGNYVSLEPATFATYAPRPLVLDTRPREEFRQAHVAGAVNIPAEEISLRLRHEWPTDMDTTLYCTIPPTCDLYRVPESGSGADECESAVDSVRAAGISRVRILEGTLSELERAGVSIAR
ncbi:MAG: rhodanese-like domain-containing protein [Vicinamibacterales bacterium]